MVAKAKSTHTKKAAKSRSDSKVLNTKGRRSAPARGHATSNKLRTSGYTFHVQTRQIHIGPRQSIQRGPKKYPVWRKDGRFSKAPKRLDYVKKSEVRKLRKFERERVPKAEHKYEKTLNRMRKDGKRLDPKQENYRTYTKRIRELEKKAEKNRIYDLPKDADNVITTLRFHIALRSEDADDLHYASDDWHVYNGSTPLGGLKGVIPFKDALQCLAPYQLKYAVEMARSLLMTGEWYLESSDARYAVFYKDKRHGPLSLMWYKNYNFNPMDEKTWPWKA